MRRGLCSLLVAVVAAAAMLRSASADVQAPISERFANESVSEVPSFQKHVSPLFGRLGCNGRACHGSFQGRGGFRLSLFGYDFKADHESLFEKDHARIDLEKPLESLIIVKPTDENEHEGGQRYERGSWQFHVFRRWIEGGAKLDGEVLKIERLEVTPSDLQFTQAGEKVSLRAVAVWPDGSREDVTPLCRFQSNDEQIAKVDEDGNVTSNAVGDSHVVVFYDNAVVPVPVVRPVSELIADKYPSVPTPTTVDQLVVQKLKKLGIVPSELCTDAEFLRRVSLDLTGTLPSAGEVESFLADSSPDKRSRKVEELLETPAYAAWWTTKLCDYTGNNGRQLNNFGVARGRASQQWYDWIYQRVAANVAYDKIVEGVVLGVSRKSGESYADFCKEMSAIQRGEQGHLFADRESMPYYWARTSIRLPEDKAIAFAYSFMGIRIQCAQCHKHPFDQWSKQDFDQFKQFFTGIQVLNGRPTGEARKEYEELITALGIDPAKMPNNNDQRRIFEQALRDGKTVPFPEVAANNQLRRARQDTAKGGKAARRATPAPVMGRVLGGEMVDLSKLTDLRQPLMEWLRDERNPYLAMAFVNRVWANYFNVGIVEPADDLSLANPPSNKALLDHLTRGFIEHGYDMKWLHREIVNSRTYQLSWVANETNQLDERNFSRAVPRRLPAEVAYDAVQIATASDQKVEALTTKLTGRAISIASAGDDQGRTGIGFALSVFGRSIRESNCDCDRSSESSLLQTVFLQNDQTVLDFIQSRDGWVSQVTKELVGAQAAAGSDSERGGARRRREAEQIVKSIERRLEALRKEGKTDEVARLERQLISARGRLDNLAKGDNAEAAEKPAVKPELTAEQLKTFVSQAYLRTLSRYPTTEEEAIARQYIADADDPATGLRGVLWALVNTKEFIVNH